MKQSIGHVSLLVRDYDEAVAYYCGVLGFRLVEDTPLTGGKRWVLVAPPGSAGTRLLLAKAKNKKERDVIGRQAGGRVFLFLHTDDFRRDHRAYRARGVRFEEMPRREAYGTVAVFQDLYGNRWDLLEPARTVSGPRTGVGAQLAAPNSEGRDKIAPLQFQRSTRFSNFLKTPRP